MVLDVSLNLCFPYFTYAFLFLLFKTPFLEVLNDAYKNVTVQVTVEDNSGEEELAIIENPKNYVGKIGETAEFKVQATGDGLTYQWEYCNASSNKWRTSSIEGNQTDTIKVEAGETDRNTAA